MSDSGSSPARPRGIRLRFFYGWLLVAIAFITMAVGVNARTRLFVAASANPRRIRVGSRRGRWCLLVRLPKLGGDQPVRRAADGLARSDDRRRAWGLHDGCGPDPGVYRPRTLAALPHAGCVCRCGVNCLVYSGQSLYLTNWFVRRRGLALSIAFSGVGAGSITILPWFAWMIGSAGWRAACVALGIFLLIVLAPVRYCQLKRPWYGRRVGGAAARVGELLCSPIILSRSSRAGPEKGALVC